MVFRLDDYPSVTLHVKALEEPVREFATFVMGSEIQRIRYQL